MNNISYMLPFLEQRNYLQGATLLNFCLKKITTYDVFSFKISKLCKSNSFTLIHEHDDKAFAHCNYSKNHEQKYIGFVELPQIHPPLREEFNEHAIITQCNFSQNKVTFFAPSATVLVQNFIAANKELLLRNRKTKEHGQWLFVCFDCIKPLHINQYYSLELDTKIAPLATTKLCCDNNLLGTIYFRWIGYDKN